MLLKWLIKHIPWFANVQKTYQGFLNIPELVYIIIMMMGTGSVGGAIALLVAHLGDIFVNASDVALFTSAISAISSIIPTLITIAERLKTGWNDPVPPPAPPAPGPAPVPTPSPSPPMV